MNYQTGQHVGHKHENEHGVIVGFDVQHARVRLYADDDETLSDAIALWPYGSLIPLRSIRETVALVDQYRQSHREAVREGARKGMDRSARHSIQGVLRRRGGVREGM